MKPGPEYKDVWAHAIQLRKMLDYLALDGFIARDCSSICAADDLRAEIAARRHFAFCAARWRKEPEKLAELYRARPLDSASLGRIEIAVELSAGGSPAVARQRELYSREPDPRADPNLAALIRAMQIARKSLVAGLMARGDIPDYRALVEIINAAGIPFSER